MRKILALPLAIAAAAASTLMLATPAQAAGTCVPVTVTTADGKFVGNQCENSDGTAIGGRLYDTKRDGRCVAIQVTFVSDGTKVSGPSCEGVWWPQYVGVSSSTHGVASITVISVPA
ncbi:hypothetical protein [Longispora albida]|uniref:hypothetical protein n=1 Tax=Longispora albida TaxID=203523 RepID=UPI00035DF81A|nr:hypothetical protein [Longispora albida]